jgi:MFS family permease
MMAISYAICLFSSSYVWLAVFAVVLGASYGSRIAAVPAVLIELFGLDNLGTTLGAFFTATGFAALLGPLLAGIAVDLSGSYYGGILFALATGIIGFAAVAALQSEPSGRTEATGRDDVRKLRLFRKPSLAKTLGAMLDNPRSAVVVVWPRQKPRNGQTRSSDL